MDGDTHEVADRLLALWLLALCSERAAFGVLDYTDNRYFVVANYIGILNRDPDVPGYTFHLNRLNTGADTRYSLTSAFLGAAEFQLRQQNFVAGIGHPCPVPPLNQYNPYLKTPNDNARFVAHLYWNVFGRCPDVPGLQFWTQILYGDHPTYHMDRTQVADSFMASPEFSLRYSARINTWIENNSSVKYQLTTSVSPFAGGTITPGCANGCPYNPGQTVTVSATPAPGHVFTGFTGSLTGMANPQNLTMTGPASVTANFSDTVISTTLEQFQNCIGSTGTAHNCVLAQNRYPVNGPLRIERSGITVMGAGGPGDTILYRNKANLDRIMVANANVSNVLIQNLTIDGNRYGPRVKLSSR